MLVDILNIFIKLNTQLLKEVLRHTKVMDQTACIINAENKTKATETKSLLQKTSPIMVNIQLLQFLVHFLEKEVDLLIEIYNFFINVCTNINKIRHVIQFMSNGDVVSVKKIIFYAANKILKLSNI